MKALGYLIIAASALFAVSFVYINSHFSHITDIGLMLIVGTAFVLVAGFGAHLGVTIIDKADARKKDGEK